MSVQRRAVIRRAAVILTTAAMLVSIPTVGAHAGGVTSAKDPTPTKAGQGVPEGTDALQAMKSVLGVQGMKNQEDLNNFKTWLIGRPHIVGQGFYESAIDVPSRRMILQWHGSSPLQAQVVAEGKRRGLTVLIKQVGYTRASVDRATSCC